MRTLGPSSRSSILTVVLATAVAACGSDGGGGGDDDVAIDAADPGGPPNLSATPGAWTWIEVPGTRCMNDTVTGMGVNLGTSGDLVIFMEGGGACFNDFTCASVAHQGGFSANELNGAIANLGDQGLFDRADQANPLRDATFVFLPYCTGDIFAGANPSGFGGRVQVGYQNIGAYLDVLVPAATPVRRIIVSGSSAGGFGALYNYDRIERAFGDDRPVFLIDDSGPPLPDQWLTPCLQTRLRELWNLSATLPAECTACTGTDGGGLANAVSFLADRHPGERLALLTSTTDGVIRTFYGFGYPTCTSTTPMPPAAYTDGVTALRTDVLAGRGNFKMFTISSGGHVWLFNPMSTTTTGGQSLGAWLTAMLAGDAGWDHASP